MTRCLARLLFCAAAVALQPAASFRLTLHRCRSLLAGPRASHPAAHRRHFAATTMAAEPPQGTPHTAQPLPNVLRMRGPVASGFGRGSKKLGFPTANLPGSLFGEALAAVAPGVYVGYALVEPPPPGCQGGAAGPAFGACHPAVVNVGFSPTFAEQNPEKIAEAYLILDDPKGFGRDFYGCTMRLVLGGFLRPEQKFPAFPTLVAQITQDVADAKAALSAGPGGDPLLLALPSNEPWLQAWREPAGNGRAPQALAQGAAEWSTGPVGSLQADDAKVGAAADATSAKGASAWKPPDRKWPAWQGDDVVTGGF